MVTYENQLSYKEKVPLIDVPLIRLFIRSLVYGSHRFHPNDQDFFPLSSAQMQSDWGYKYMDKRDYWFELVDKNYSWKKGVTKAWRWKPGKADEVKRFCLDNTDKLPALISKYEATSKPTSVLREQWSAGAVDSLLNSDIFENEDHLLATKLTLSTFTREGDLLIRDIACFESTQKYPMFLLSIHSLPEYILDYLITYASK